MVSNIAQGWAGLSGLDEGRVGTVPDDMVNCLLWCAAPVALGTVDQAGFTKEGICASARRCYVSKKALVGGVELA